MATVTSDETCYDEVVSHSENAERSIGSLSDELWLRVLRLGVDGGFLDHKDLCSLSCVSHRLSRLSSSDSIWQRAFHRKFAPPSDTVGGTGQFANSSKREEYHLSSSRLGSSKKRKHSQHGTSRHRSLRTRQVVVQS
jgi:hypothetical protein